MGVIFQIFGAFLKILAIKLKIGNRHLFNIKNTPLQTSAQRNTIPCIIYMLIDSLKVILLSFGKKILNFSSIHIFFSKSLKIFHIFILDWFKCLWKGVRMSPTPHDMSSFCFLNYCNFDGKK